MPEIPYLKYSFSLFCTTENISKSNRTLQLAYTFFMFFIDGTESIALMNLSIKSECVTFIQVYFK